MSLEGIEELARQQAREREERAQHANGHAAGHTNGHGHTPADDREAPTGGATDTDPDAATAEEHLTDLGNARRLVRMHGQDLRHTLVLKQWNVFDGKRWAPDMTGEVPRRAKDVALSFYPELAALPDDRARKELRAHAVRSESEKGLRAMIEVASSERSIAVGPEVWDADPWRLNVLNGTIDLRTGTLRPHRREDYLTKLAPVHYDPDARLDLFDRYLDTATQGDAELAAFLRRCAGYSLTGDTSEEVLLFVHGPTQSGKSTLIEAINATLGDYAHTADFETFLKRKHVTGGPRNDIARLAGARFVSSIEVEDGKALAEAIVKQLTGGDTIAVRFLYKEHFEYVPQFTLWLAANHAPKVREDDGAMWRRILRIPFIHTIPEGERDPGIKKTLKDPAVGGPAVLAWAVRGSLEWQAQGLNVPDVVRLCTAQYRSEMDPLAEFFADVCVLSPEAYVRFDALWEAYERYTHHERGALSKKSLAQRLTTRGFVADRQAGGVRIRRGIGLATNGQETSNETE